MFEVASRHLFLPRGLLTTCCDLLRTLTSHERRKTTSAASQVDASMQTAKLCPPATAGISAIGGRSCGSLPGGHVGPKMASGIEHASQRGRDRPLARHPLVSLR